jgi:hypothetical protein
MCDLARSANKCACFGTSLTAPAWTPVAVTPLVGGWAYFSDPQWTNYPTRFYRLRAP